MKRQTIFGAVAALSLAACQGGDDMSLSQKQQETTLPAQTPLVVSLNTDVDSRTQRAGDTFRTTLSEPILVEDAVALPAGTTLLGELKRVEHKDGDVRMELRLTEVELPGGNSEDLHTGDLQLVAQGTSTEDDLEKVALGGVAGGILGAVVGGGKGAAIGAAAGAGAGTVVAVTTRKDGEILIPAGQKLRFVLTDDVTLPQRRIS